MTGKPDENPGDEELIARPGTYGTVRFARLEDGSTPGKDLYDDLEYGAKGALQTLFQMITSSPTLELTNRRKFKQVKGKLYEFKVNRYQLRMFCFRYDDAWYLTSGFTKKKEDDLPKGVVDGAMKVMERARSVLDAEKKANSKK
jgi:hypothetical protein